MTTVALESTIIAHGPPWPDNLPVGRELEATPRARRHAGDSRDTSDQRVVVGGESGGHLEPRETR